MSVRNLESINMSLDDIIKKTKPAAKVSNGAVKPSGAPHRLAKPMKPVPQKRIVTDARNKIIFKNRLRIRDARDMLAEKERGKGDARLKLIRKLGEKPLIKKPKPYAMPHHPRGPPPMMYMDDMDIMEDYPVQLPLRRTVHNEMSSYYPTSTPPPFPLPFHPSGRRSSPPPARSNDPFDCYELPPARPAELLHQINMRRKVHYSGAELSPRKGILRSTRQASPDGMHTSHHRQYAPEIDSHLSYEMRTRLERAPDPHASMGIFSNPLAVEKSSSFTPNGYRIVVSNLHTSVTQSDIKELFEDIGELFAARLVRLGVAEVIFKTLKDAETAVDTYHNRQLDGQPMKCLLVNPRQSNNPTAPALRSNR